MFYSKLSEAAVRKFSSKYVLFKISRYRKTLDKYNKTPDRILRKAPVKKSFIHKIEVTKLKSAELCYRCFSRNSMNAFTTNILYNLKALLLILPL